MESPQVRTYEQMRQLMELGRRVAPHLQGASEIWRPTSASVTRSRRRTHLACCMLRDDSCSGLGALSADQAWTYNQVWAKQSCIRGSYWVRPSWRALR